MSVRLMSQVYAAHFHDISIAHRGKKKTTGEEYEKTINILNSNLKSVCLALADNANDEGEGSYPGLDTLTQKTELSEVTVVACLKGMKQEEIIIYTGRSKWNTCNYTINKAKIAEMGTWERQKRKKPETKATLVLKQKPLQLETKATLENPFLHPKPSFNDEEKRAAEALALEEQKRAEESRAIETRVETLRKLYEANVGPITPLMMSILRNAAIDYPNQEWYEPAFTAMIAGADHRSWNYVDKVLGGWKEHYFGWRPEYKLKGVKHGTKRSPDNSGDNPGLSEDGQRVADEINRQRAAKKAALPAVQ